MSNADFIYRRIEAAAQARVSKSGESVSLERAMTEYLRTPEGRARYAAYKDAQRGEIAKSMRDATANPAGLVDVAKARDDAYAAIVRLAGEDTPEAITKALSTEAGKALYRHYKDGEATPAARVAKSDMSADQVAFLKALRDGERVQVSKADGFAHGSVDATRWGAEDAGPTVPLTYAGDQASGTGLSDDSADTRRPTVEADGSVSIHHDIVQAMRRQHDDEPALLRRYSEQRMPAAKQEAIIVMRRIARRFGLKSVAA